MFAFLCYTCFFKLGNVYFMFYLISSPNTAKQDFVDIYVRIIWTIF